MAELLKTALASMCKTFEKAGFKCKVVDAPKDAMTFDKLLIVFSDPAEKMIRQVHMYSSKQDRFIGSV